MQNKTKKIMRELIDFYEANGRNKKKTVDYFKTKNVKDHCTYKLIQIYEREGLSALDKKITRRPPVVFPQITKNVLDLLREDPSVSCCEGAATLNISAHTFRTHRKMLLNPGMLSTEKKIQLGLIPRPLPQPPPPEKEETIESSSDEEDLEVKVKVKEEDENDDEDEGEGKFLEKSNPALVLKSKRQWQPFRRCLLCFINLGRYIEKESTENRRCCANSNSSSPILNCSIETNCDCEIGENMSVIFALKNIFGLSSAQLHDFMTTSNGRNPRDWYDLCGHCDALLKDAMAVGHQILKLTKELDKHKKKIMKTFEESSFRSSVVEDLGLRYDNYRMTRLIRESISPEKKKQVSTEHLQNLLEPQKPTDPHDNDTTDNVAPPPPQVQNEISISEEHRSRDNASSIPDSDVPINPLGIGRVDVVDARTTTFRNLVKPSQTVCETCGKEVRKNEIPVHALLEHGVLLEGYKKFECPMEGCQYKTVYEERFKSHKRNVHRPKCLACQFCEKKFSSKSYLAQHEEAHKNKETKPFQCEQCGLGFAIKDYLRIHKREVHEGKRRRLAERKSFALTNSTVISNAETVTTAPPLFGGIYSSRE